MAKQKHVKPGPPKTPRRKAEEAATGVPVPAAATPFAVVGIGASAGGLEAFSELLTHLPADTGMAFVLVQHLDPAHPSLLTELLARKSSMPVVQIQDGMQLAPNRVYVLPPHSDVKIRNRELVLTQFSKEQKRMPVDVFFRSLAESEKSRAIGVVLSGTASDGTLGLEAIKAEGGITFAQNEKSAKFDGMPRSAIAAGCVDFVLTPEEIARELEKLGRHPYVTAAAGAEEEEPAPVGDEQDLGKLFQILRNSTGVDFTYYKHPTVRRRIRRRMMLRQQESLNKYVRDLLDNPVEIDALFQDLLINVTGFFRDGEEFELLKERVFRR